MPPRGSAVYSPLMPRTDWRYDPSLAEEALERQRQDNAARLAQIADQGQIAAEGIRAGGEAISGAIDKGVSGYLKGKERAREEEAHALRTKMAEDDLTGSGKLKRDADLRKTEEEINQLKKGKPGPTPAVEWTNTGQVDEQGNPIMFNRVTGSYKSGDIKVKAKPGGAGGGLTPYQQTTLDNRKDDKLDSKTTGYSERLARSNIPTAVAQLERVYTMLPPEGDAPGYGRVAGALPDTLVSQKGEDLRQGVQAVFNIELKDRSGAAVSDQELNRLKREFGEGSWKTPDQLRKGLAQYEARLKEVMRNIDAGEDPAVREEYVKRGGRDFSGFKGRSTPAEPKEEDTALAGPKKPPPEGKVRVKKPDGSVGLIPESQLEQAKAQGYLQVQ